MTISNQLHAVQAAKARSLYLDTMKPDERAADWKFALKEARQLIIDSLRASDFLRNVASALEKNGGWMIAFRHLLAPPVSQDQFKLSCPTWPKSSEKSGRPLAPQVAAGVASEFDHWRDRRLTRWLDHGRNPTISELRHALAAVAPLIAAQRLATARRNRLASEQEQAVIELLQHKGWKKLPSKLIDTRAAVPSKCFMHKTRFATATTAPQEVDIACGLKGTVVLAMECKVTNDETNSVKRINDVLKKAAAWRTHWGSFVVTAALLQGVIAAKDVERLIDSNVEVFWSHELDQFASWLDSKL